MSLVFSNTTTKSGIIQRIERRLGFADATISGDSTLLAQFTGDVNVAHDIALATIFAVGGKWQFDDSNHGDYPIITTNLVSGQRDYSFTVDGNSNLILEVFRVLVSDQNGNFFDIDPVDVSGHLAPTSYTDGRNTTGLPSTYDKLGTGIFLDPPSNYNKTGGLKIYISREGSYFATTDTTKKPGIAGLFHEWYVLYPAYQYAYSKDLPQAVTLEKEMEKMRDAMKEYYKAREKDTKKEIIPRRNSAR